MLIFLFICLPVQTARADELESLMQAMAAVKHRIVRYSEDKQMDGLESLLEESKSLPLLNRDDMQGTFVVAALESLVLTSENDSFIG